MSEFTREITFGAAYDKRDPDPDKNYGIGGVTLRFLLRGPQGVVQFVLFTNWQLPEVTKSQMLRLAAPHEVRFVSPERELELLTQPMPADVGYHSLTPLYEGQEVLTPECPYLGGHPCYYDGSGMAAEPLYEVLLHEGSDGVWRELETYYRETFEESA